MRWEDENGSDCFGGWIWNAKMCIRDRECELSPMSAHAMMGHLDGRFEEGANVWYAAFQRNEEYLLHAPEAGMSLLTRNRCV